MEIELQKCKEHEKKCHVFCQECYRPLCVKCIVEHSLKEHQIISLENFFIHFRSLISQYEAIAKKYRTIIEEIDDELRRVRQLKGDEERNILDVTSRMIGSLSLAKDPVVNGFHDEINSQVSSVTQLFEQLKKISAQLHSFLYEKRGFEEFIQKQRNSSDGSLVEMIDFSKVQDFFEVIGASRKFYEEKYCKVMTNLDKVSQFYSVDAEFEDRTKFLIRNSINFNNKVALENGIDSEVSGAKGEEETTQYGGFESDDLSVPLEDRVVFVDVYGPYYKSIVESITSTTIHISYNGGSGNCLYTAESNKNFAGILKLVTEDDLKNLKEPPLKPITIINTNTTYYKVSAVTNETDKEYTVDYYWATGEDNVTSMTVDKRESELLEVISLDQLTKERQSYLLKAMLTKPKIPYFLYKGETVLMEESYTFKKGTIQSITSNSLVVKSASGLIWRVALKSACKIMKFITTENYHTFPERGGEVLWKMGEEWIAFKVLHINSVGLTVKTAGGLKLQIPFDQNLRDRLVYRIPLL